MFSTYGNTELAASLCECEAGRGGHLHPELLHVEALDDSGQPVPDGQVGELTATTFGVEAINVAVLAGLAALGKVLLHCLPGRTNAFLAPEDA